jgi:hypothetical protein
VVAIGPAGNAVVMGGEDRQNMTAPSQLIDGIDWAIAENSREGSAYYHKLDVTKIAVSGQSCGAQQAIQVSDDPRVTTTVALSQGINIGPPPAGRGPNEAGRGPNAAGAAAGPGRAGGGRGPVATDQRYAPFAPVLVRAPADPSAPASAPTAQNRGAEILAKIHAPIIFITGGDTDTGHRSATMDFEAIDQVPEVHAWQQVGHYPATYREPNGGAFAQAAGAWLKWQLKGDKKASLMFVGPSCGLCTDPKWTIEKKHID